MDKATDKDLPYILTLLEQNSLPHEGIEEHLHTTLVKYQDNALVGCVALEHYAPYALLRSLAVDEKVRNQSYGKHLTLAALELAYTLGARQVYLLTQTAQDFFTRFFGFVGVERSQIPDKIKNSIEFVSACPQSAQAMVLDLNGCCSPQMQDTQDKRASVQSYYAQRAKSKTSCCSSNPAKSFYNFQMPSEIPSDVAGFSLGCGDPITLASLKPGETVLDLGSGGGLDCFLAVKRVGETGKVIGVDMTPEMLDKSTQEARRLGFANIDFRHGYLEDLPVENASIDVIISNCVFNLSVDKSTALREMFRVLKAGGRLAISDIVSKDEIPDTFRQDLQAWASCASGAMSQLALKQALEYSGFTNIAIVPKGDGGVSLPELGVDALFSAQISAIKP